MSDLIGWALFWLFFSDLKGRNRKHMEISELGWERNVDLAKDCQSSPECFTKINKEDYDKDPKLKKLRKIP